MLLAVVAGAYAGIAQALDFDDEDPHPPHPEIGLVYHYEIGTHAGCLPHHVVISSGQLPPGLKLSQLNDHTALVDGMATEAGTFSAWMAVKDCENRSAEALFTFETYTRRWAITTDSLTPVVLGSPYSLKLEGKGIQSNVTWAISAGSLPAGLTLSSDGTISGIPTAPGASTFTVKATAVSTDPAAPGTRVDSRQFTFNVSGSLSVALSRRVAEVGIPVRSALVATGGTGPYTWSAKGATPAGLRIGADGSITGVPKHTGAYTLSAHVVDANGTAKDVQATLLVRPRLAIAARSLRPAVAGHAYRAKVALRGGVGPMQWSGKLPSGLKLDAQTGTISGVLAHPGTFRIKLRVRDALGAIAAKTLVLSAR